MSDEVENVLVKYIYTGNTDIVTPYIKLNDVTNKNIIFHGIFSIYRY